MILFLLLSCGAPEKVIEHGGDSNLLPFAQAKRHPVPEVELTGTVNEMRTDVETAREDLSCIKGYLREVQEEGSGVSYEEYENVVCKGEKIAK